jgi:DNA-binding SARP family transcriptional activator
MSALSVRLFGTFTVQRQRQDLQTLQAGKPKELFCYLLLHRNKPHPRELLAAVFWPDCTTAQSRKYLRQTLWQLQQAMPVSLDTGSGRVLLSDSELENAFTPVRLLAGEELDETHADALRSAVGLYCGDLLEGWYQDWCLYERERLQNIYFTALEKLMAYCEFHHDYDSGVAHGESILRHDRARERTHAKLMRLHYLMGDRAGAVRQFQRCVSALREELDVAPAKRTVELYEQIRTDQLESPIVPPTTFSLQPTSDPSVPLLVRHLQRIRSLLLHLSQCVKEDIDVVNQALAAPATPDTHADHPHSNKAS